MRQEDWLARVMDDASSRVNDWPEWKRRADAFVRDSDEQRPEATRDVSETKEPRQD